MATLSPRRQGWCMVEDMRLQKSQGVNFSKHVPASKPADSFSWDKALIVIDSRVDQLDFFLKAAPVGAKVLIVEPDRDGIADITHVLGQYPFQTLHLVSHGAPGCLYVGCSPIQAATLDSYGDQLARWSVQEIHLYACEVAQDQPSKPIGSTFLDRLYQLTGASIAASAHRLGQAALAGYGNLEYQLGQIFSAPAFSEQSLQAYPGLLVATFGAKTDLGIINAPTVQEPILLADGDLDADGDIDLVAVLRNGNSLAVLLNDGAGTFTISQLPVNTVPNFPRVIATGDFNKDGRADLVLANGGTESPVITLLLASAATPGTFDAPVNIALPATAEVLAGPYVTGEGETRKTDVAVGDVNRDGNQDLVYTIKLAGVSSVVTRLGDGAGAFGNPILSTAANGPRSLAVGDLNADGYLDVVTGSYDTDQVSIQLGTGTGAFGAPTSLAVGAAGVEPTQIAIADMDGDGDLDIVTSNRDGSTPAFTGSFSILLNDGMGGFAAATTLDAGPTPAESPPAISLDLADFDGDGDVDVLLALPEPNQPNVPNNSTSTVSVYLNPGSGDATAFTPNNPTAAPNTPLGIVIGQQFPPAAQPPNISDVQAADFNGDGRTDLASIAVTQGIVTSIPNQTNLGTPFLSLAAVSDAAEAGLVNGVLQLRLKEVLAAPITVNFALAGSATLGTDYTITSGSPRITNLDTGAGTFQLTAGAAGDFDFTVTPIDDNALEGFEAVQLTLNPGAGYALGNPRSSSIFIQDDELLGVVGTNIFQSSVAQSLSFSLTQRSFSTVSEVGLFLVDNDAGQIGTLTPGDAGYVAAALSITRSTTLFSSISNQFFSSLNFSRITSAIAAGQRFAFYLVQNGSAEEVRTGKVASSQVSLATTTDLQVAIQGNNTFNLNWRDAATGNFDSLQLTLQPATAAPNPVTALQGQNAVLDLSTLTGQRTATFTLSREAAFNNFAGLYVVQDAAGTVIDPTNGLAIAPGQPNYIQAALANVVAGLDFSLNNLQQVTKTTQLPGGGLLAPFMITNGGTIAQLQDNDPSNDPNIFFPFAGANADGVDHVQVLGDNAFGFEDILGGGDRDFNDLILQVDIA